MLPDLLFAGSIQGATLFLNSGPQVSFISGAPSGDPKATRKNNVNSIGVPLVAPSIHQIKGESRDRPQGVESLNLG